MIAIPFGGKLSSEGPRKKGECGEKSTAQLRSPAWGACAWLEGLALLRLWLAWVISGLSWASSETLSLPSPEDFGMD